MSRVVRSEGLPYQGYPYVNPPVIDAPSLNPAEVEAQAKWHNLPRKPLRGNEDTRRQDPTGGSGVSGSGNGSSVVADSMRIPQTDKEDLEDQPVVYIDIPESTASEVSQTREKDGEPDYVQETILYDPFKDRRIEIPRESDTDSEGSSGGRPQPPSTLHLASPGSSGYNSALSTSTSLPSFLSKEAYVYGRQPTPDDGFPLSPIPVSEFPAPPPAYEEIQGMGAESQRHPMTRPQEPTVTVEQPRTQVILPSPTSPTLTIDGTRKLVTCQHCGATVQTLVIKQNGFFTHALAFFFFFFCMPVVILIYCTDFCKYRNHYCPSCNQKVGHENPMCRENELQMDS